MHQYYGWEAVERLPLLLIPKLIIDAKKKETEKIMYPMWLVHVIQATINQTEIVPIQDFLSNEKTTTKSADEIINDMLPIVDEYRKRGV